ncbi:hypothetical protein G7054_g2578 [Neopestalotiopsis clavispora]|nr:hypothetical protein G7054_g2578 [Neopestalotiopsis clavispora]
MPYLHWGYLCDLPLPTEGQPKSQAHPRRTLDQADNPYLSADDLNQRNHDQVVTRFLKSSRVQYKDLTCMMVDQLWVWLLDKWTIVTSFPDTPCDCQKENYGQPCREHNIEHLAIWHAGGRFGDMSARELRGHLLFRSLQIFDQKAWYSQRELQYFFFFQRSIVDQRKRAVELLDQRNIFQLSADKFNTFFNDDVEAIIATRDIRDELKMLINITGLQLSALARLPHGTCRANILEFQQSLERMVAETKEVEEMLAKALEIKQSIISLQQNKISLQQNRIVLTFTIVTVVFLPLGFISSVFGMNATEWNPDSPWGIRTMFMYMCESFDT